MLRGEQRLDELLIVNRPPHAVDSVPTWCFRDLRSKISRSPVILIIRSRALVERAGRQFLGDWVWGRISRSFKSLSHAGGLHPAAQHLGSCCPTPELEQSTTWPHREACGREGTAKA